MLSKRELVLFCLCPFLTQKNRENSPPELFWEWVHDTHEVSLVGSFKGQCHYKLQSRDTQASSPSPHKCMIEWNHLHHSEHTCASLSAVVQQPAAPHTSIPLHSRPTESTRCAVLVPHAEREQIRRRERGPVLQRRAVGLQGASSKERPGQKGC